jgi:type VI secretion system protein ImpE
VLADDKLREGQLDEALTELQAEVRRHPSNVKYRIFLFQLLSVLGRWDRAATQLQVVGDLDAKTLPMVQTYRTALDCEALRASVFAGTKTPLIFGDPEDWLARMVQALQFTAHGRHQDAGQLRGEALAQAPALPGEIDGQSFEWIADADSRLGPICEAIINGKYYWVPFHRIHLISIDPPSDLRDVIWMPARLTFANGGESVALIPTRYPGSESHAEAAVRLGRKTDWAQITEGTFLGVGQRMFATDASEYPLMEARRIRIGEPSSGE